MAKAGSDLRAAQQLRHIIWQGLIAKARAPQPYAALLSNHIAKRLLPSNPATIGCRSHLCAAFASTRNPKPSLQRMPHGCAPLQSCAMMRRTRAAQVARSLYHAASALQNCTANADAARRLNIMQSAQQSRGLVAHSTLPVHALRFGSQAAVLPV